MKDEDLNHSHNRMQNKLKQCEIDNKRDMECRDKTILLSTETSTIVNLKKEKELRER